jgi:hypothetical protein
MSWSYGEQSRWRILYDDACLFIETQIGSVNTQYTEEPNKIIGVHLTTNNAVLKPENKWHTRIMHLEYLVNNFSTAIAWMWYFILASNDSSILKMEKYWEGMLPIENKKTTYCLESWNAIFKGLTFKMKINCEFPEATTILSKLTGCR